MLSRSGLLEDAANNCIESGIELFSYRSLEIRVKAGDKVFYMVGNVMVF